MELSCDMREKVLACIHRPSMLWTLWKTSPWKSRINLRMWGNLIYRAIRFRFSEESAFIRWKHFSLAPQEFQCGTKEDHNEWIRGLSAGDIVIFLGSGGDSGIVYGHNKKSGLIYVLIQDENDQKIKGLRFNSLLSGCWNNEEGWFGRGDAHDSKLILLRPLGRETVNYVAEKTKGFIAEFEAHLKA